MIACRGFAAALAEESGTPPEFPTVPMITKGYFGAFRAAGVGRAMPLPPPPAGKRGNACIQPEVTIDRPQRGQLSASGEHSLRQCGHLLRRVAQAMYVISAATGKRQAKMPRISAMLAIASVSLARLLVWLKQYDDRIVPRIVRYVCVACGRSAENSPRCSPTQPAATAPLPLRRTTHGRGLAGLFAANQQCQRANCPITND